MRRKKWQCTNCIVILVVLFCCKSTLLLMPPCSFRLESPPFADFRLLSPAVDATARQKESNVEMVVFLILCWLI